MKGGDTAMAMVEREQELVLLEALLASAVMGRGRVALVGGAVATGKSTLLHTFAEQAIELGALAVTATGSPLERDVPLGVLRQLVEDAPLVPQERERALSLLEEGAQAVAAGADERRPVDAQLVHALCGVLLDLSERCPLVLVVDDVHHADRESLLCLAYLARRVRLAQIVAIFGHADQAWHTDSYFQTELLRQPHCRRVRLTRLSRAGVAAMLAARLGDEAAERLADEMYAHTGGNPLLVTALADDYEESARTAPEPPAGVVVGEQYGQAVLSCLSRGEARVARAARGLAVLGEPRSLDLLLGVPAAEVNKDLHSLGAAGLTALGTFRHEAARQAVLGAMDAGERAELHRRAAELSYGVGASPAVVARHLLEAGRVDAPWGIEILEEAARSALRAGQVDSAVGYLRLAWRACADDTQRAKIMTMLVRAEWRINPAAPAGRLAELAEAVHRGSLRGGDAVVLARALLWHGRVDDARDVLEQVLESGGTADQETRAELVVARLCLRAAHPPFLTALGHMTKEEGPGGIVSVSVSRRLESALALAEVLTRGPREEYVDAVERILEDSRLDEMSLDTVENSLLTLTYAGRAERAAPLCDMFAAEASARQAPSRRARLAAIRAEIAIRQGDMPAAERHARAALQIIPMSGWGVAVGGPLGSLIFALTTMGRYDEVREHLDVPVPEVMFQTRYGLHYLHARGRHSLATGYPALALGDFRRCGDLMTEWNLDTPGLIPWRADAAEACLRLGRVEEARELVRDQLDGCVPDDPRGRGVALRLLAATLDPGDRPALLRQATGCLQAAGDRYELARALADLVETYDALGEYRRARTIATWAQAVAAECGVEPPASSLSPAHQQSHGAPRSGSHGGSSTGSGGGPERGATATAARPSAVPLGELSDAERRVASLAAAGCTNREIAAKLFVTVSTVEQHLTRTYRKLGITRRSDLPLVLEFGEQAGV
ncbi:AAA family ATPase [Microbispora sp. H10836]|uniref:helix-turn-helix transcriptional regulator n=1 Tax=Microbispora sp. H10836 TaxID=2729106 RepID=UPI0028932535|nr:AAA family ATPase [Microbispora sp. H10836]